MAAASSLKITIEQQAQAQGGQSVSLFKRPKVNVCLSSRLGDPTQTHAHTHTLAYIHPNTRRSPIKVGPFCWPTEFWLPSAGSHHMTKWRTSDDCVLAVLLFVCGDCVDYFGEMCVKGNGAYLSCHLPFCCLPTRRLPLPMPGDWFIWLATGCGCCSFVFLWPTLLHYTGFLGHKQLAMILSYYFMAINLGFNNAQTSRKS